MFRLIKNSGGCTNAPLFERFSREGCSISPTAGSAVKREINTITHAGYYPVYIVAKDCSDNEDYLCYKVTGDMIFKVEFVGTIPAVVGKHVMITQLGKVMGAVEMNDNGPGRILAISDDKKYVYVQFDRIKEHEEW